MPHRKIIAFKQPILTMDEAQIISEWRELKEENKDCLRTLITAAHTYNKLSEPETAADYNQTKTA